MSNFQQRHPRLSWLLNTEGKGGIFSRPLDWLGLEQHQGRWTFGGYATSNIPGSTGRWWVPPIQDRHGVEIAAGKFGSWKEIGEAANKAGSLRGGARGLARNARMRFGRFLGPSALLAFDLIPGIRDNLREGYGLPMAVGKAAVSTATTALVFRVAAAALSTPAGFAIGAMAAAGAGYINYNNKMANFRKEVKRTEFVGDMSAFESQAAVTSRQRATQAISRSYYNARNVMGNEAQYNYLPKSFGFGAGGNPALYF